MTDFAIQLRNISKKYVLSGKSRDQSTGKPSGKKGREFWALKGINLEVKKGELVGIIGANGAGKSTLLKILTGVTSPTEGAFEVNGKLNALLELGTGFHGELTGLENIYVGGALHGISRAEIRRQMNDIIRFSGIGTAIGQATRTYSSGMYVRLAFSLAIHLKPDILLLDEVLAVGDERFQKQCFEVIQEFHRRGVTILLVSHDMRLISMICKRVIVLEKGSIHDENEPHKAIENYNRCRARKLISGSTEILYYDRKIHLCKNAEHLTDAFGVCTSFRSNAIWFDSQLMDWQIEEHTESVLMLSGASFTKPLKQKWRFESLGDGSFKWTVVFKVLEEFSLERIQCNIMLNRRFDHWELGSDKGVFPEAFDPECGEDWERVAIQSPDEPISAFLGVDGRELHVGMHSWEKNGAFVVVNSNPFFSCRLLQYLRVLPDASGIEPGDYGIFDCVIRTEQLLSPDIQQDHTVSVQGS